MVLFVNESSSPRHGPNHYPDFVRSFFDIADPRARAFIDDALEDSATSCPYLLQVARPTPASRRSTTSPGAACCMRKPRASSAPPRTNRSNSTATSRMRCNALPPGKLRRHVRHRLRQEPDVFSADHRRPDPQPAHRGSRRRLRDLPDERSGELAAQRPDRAEGALPGALRPPVPGQLCRIHRRHA